MNKPQTCYVVNNGKTDLTLNGIGKFEYVNELTDRYIFTKEELEAHDIQMHKNDGMDKVIDYIFFLLDHDILTEPYTANEILTFAKEIKSRQNRKQ